MSIFCPGTGVGVATEWGHHTEVGRIARFISSSTVLQTPPHAAEAQLFQDSVRAGVL
jgi:hypothetical protein